jgi:hypothetical protein
VSRLKVADSTSGTHPCGLASMVQPSPSSKDDEAREERGLCESGGEAREAEPEQRRCSCMVLHTLLENRPFIDV